MGFHILPIAFLTKNILDKSSNSGVNFTPLLFFVQDYVSPNKICRKVSMLYVRGAFADSHGAADFFRDNDAHEVVDASDYSGCFHNIKAPLSD